MESNSEKPLKLQRKLNVFLANIFTINALLMGIIMRPLCHCDSHVMRITLLPGGMILVGMNETVGINGTVWLNVYM